MKYLTKLLLQKAQREHVLVIDILNEYRPLQGDNLNAILERKKWDDYNGKKRS